MAYRYADETVNAAPYDASYAPKDTCSQADGYAGQQKMQADDTQKITGAVGNGSALQYRSPTTLDRLHKSRAAALEQFTLLNKAIDLYEKNPQFADFTELKDILQRVSY